MRDSTEIARALEDIALLLALSGESQFRIRAYERGAQIVLELADELGPLIESGQLTGVEGIGPSLARQIEELWSTGGSSLLAQLRSAYPPGAVELARIPGMTPKRVRALHDALGIGSVEELRTACLEQRVRGVPGFGAKTEQKLLAAIERARTAPAEPRILLADALRVAERIERALCGAGAAQRVFTAGAARRFAETVTELELVAVTRDADAVWRELARSPLTARVDRAAGRADLVHGVPLFVHVAEPDDAGRILLLSTGPADHVQALRERAAERGLALETLRASEEAEIYAALGLPLVPPELRDAGSARAPGAVYDGLLQERDVRGLVHCHTTYSDGRNTVEEMARAAKALGMQYITITDHSPSARYAGGVELDRLQRQWDEIAEVSERVGIRILRGTESDILADGSLDYPDAVLERFDVVIASIHSRFKMDRARMTDRLVRAMALPCFKIWGHALGRLLLSREPFACDLPAVLDALARSRGAVELNGDPRRLDLAPEWIPLARERGLPFVVSVDAHSTESLRVLPFAVGLARRGGVQRTEVLNTLGPDEFAARVRPCG